MALNSIVIFALLGAVPGQSLLFSDSDTKIIMPDVLQEDVEVGDSVTLVCESTGPILWLFRRMPPMPRDGLKIVKTNGIRSDGIEVIIMTLTIDSVIIDDSGQFECRRDDEFYERDTIFLVVHEKGQNPFPRTSTPNHSITQVIKSRPSTTEDEPSTRGPLSSPHPNASLQKFRPSSGGSRVSLSIVSIILHTLVSTVHSVL